MSEIKLTESNVAYITNKDRKRFYVYWSLGNTCTYHCSYCPTRFHDGSAKYQSLEIVQQTMAKLSDLPTEVHVKFTGGEATFHPDFEEIVRTAPERVKISVISNASRPIAFWERIVDKLFTVTLTYHAEFANLERFLKTARLIYIDNKKPGTINLTMIPELWDTCIAVYDAMIENKLPVNVKPLLENFGFKSERMLSSYTKEHIQWIKDKTKSSTYKPIGIYDKNDVKIGSTNPSELLSLSQTNFAGWMCYNQTKFLDIDWNGNAFDSACAQRKHVGSIYDGFEISTEPVLCKTNFCWCHSDIETLKTKSVL